jgi:hypothetical protein
VTPDKIEHRKPVFIADDSLAIDDARAQGQPLDSISGERESIGEVMAVARPQPHATASAVRHDAEAVMLDFVNPARPRRRLVSDPR